MTFKTLGLTALCAGVLACGDKDAPLDSDSSLIEADTDTDTDADTDADSDTDSDADADPTWSDAFDIFGARCSGCHVGGNSGTLTITSDSSSVVNKKSSTSLDYVEPGDTDASYLWLKLNGRQSEAGGGGVKMPKSGAVTAEELNLLEAWILAGAPE